MVERQWNTNRSGLFDLHPGTFKCDLQCVGGQTEIRLQPKSVFGLDGFYSSRQIYRKSRRHDSTWQQDIECPFGDYYSAVSRFWLFPLFICTQMETAECETVFFIERYVRMVHGGGFHQIWRKSGRSIQCLSLDKKGKANPTWNPPSLYQMDGKEPYLVRPNGQGTDAVSWRISAKRKTNSHRQKEKHIQTGKSFFGTLHHAFHRPYFVCGTQDGK